MFYLSVRMHGLRGGIVNWRMIVAVMYIFVACKCRWGSHCGTGYDWLNVSGVFVGSDASASCIG